MERDVMKTAVLGRSSQLRFSVYLGTMLALGLLLGFAMPVGSASAGVGAAPAGASEALILIGNKNNNKNNNNNNNNWNKKNWNNKNVVVVRPYRHWNKKNYYG